MKGMKVPSKVDLFHVSELSIACLVIATISLQPVLQEALTQSKFSESLDVLIKGWFLNSHWSIVLADSLIFIAVLGFITVAVMYHKNRLKC
jgi:hypothetical protein